MNFKLGKVNVGDNCPTYIVAEMSGNHGGSKEKGLEIIRAAKRAGANAIKLQTYTADTITLDCNSDDFIIDHGPWKGKKNLHSLYKEAFTPWEWHADFFKEARKLDLEIFSAPFDLTSVDFLETLKPSFYKIASPEITDIPLIKKVAECNKPIIISTGCANLEDIELAIATIKQAGNEEIIILKCTSSYPAPIEEANLNTITDMKKRFSVLSGLSDHTLGTTASIVSVVLGASLIEKHFLIDKTEETVDSFFSLDESEFKHLVEEIRIVEKSLGKVEYNITASVEKNIKWRRSLYIAEDIKKGAIFSEANVKSVRPAFGLHPKHYFDILGKSAKVDLKKGDRLSWEVINN